MMRSAIERTTVAALVAFFATIVALPGAFAQGSEWGSSEDSDQEETREETSSEETETDESDDQKAAESDEEADESSGSETDSEPSTSAKKGDIDGPGDASYSIQGSNLVIYSGEGQADSFRVPCSESAAASEEQLYIVCQSGRLLTMSLADPADPEPTGMKDLGKKATNLYRVKGNIWVDFSDGSSGKLADYLGGGDGEARAASDQSESASSKDEYAASESDDDGDEGGDDDDGDDGAPKADASLEEPPIAKVTKVGNGYVIVDAGTQNGLEEGDGLSFASVRKKKVGGEVVERYKETVGAGIVETAGQTQSRVALRINDSVPKGSEARRDAVDMAPGSVTDRVENVFITKGAIRPFLPIGYVGIGSLIDLHASYHFDFPFTLEFRVSPFGFAITSQHGSVVSLTSNLIASYDTQYIQAGLGIGLAHKSAQNVVVPSFQQRVRFGSRDGVHLEGTSNFILQGSQGWTPGGVRLKFGFPMWSLLERTWGLMRFQAGVPGQTFFELGMRIMTAGNGTAGTTFITPLIGLASIRSTLRRFQTNTQYFIGPLVGIEIERRF